MIQGMTHSTALNTLVRDTRAFDTVVLPGEQTADGPAVTMEVVEVTDLSKHRGVRGRYLLTGYVWGVGSSAELVTRVLNGLDTLPLVERTR
jgi:hypothetical protein